jgi:hypothetical protein
MARPSARTQRSRLTRQCEPVATRSNQNEQDAFLSVYHAASHTFSATPCAKIVENHLGKAFMKMNFVGLAQQIQLVPVPPAPAPTPSLQLLLLLLLLLPLLPLSVSGCCHGCRGCGTGLWQR